MQTEETRVLMDRYLERRMANDPDLEEFFAEDVEWQLPASVCAAPYAGRAQVLELLTGGLSAQVLDGATEKREVVRVLIDGDTAAVEQRLTARTHWGAEYVNEYCWIYSWRNGKIAHLREYNDTLHGARIFGKALGITLDTEP